MPAKPLSRRHFLRTLLATGAGLLAGCATSPPSPTASSTIQPPTSALIPTPTLTPTATSTPTPPPTATPTPAPSDLIKQIVVFIQENHTFDSLFAGFPDADGEYAGRDCPDALINDPPHQHDHAFATGGATTAEAACSYNEASTPIYWRLAHEFTLCDRYFTDVRGPSHPNYLMLIAAQSPIVNTPFPIDTCPDFCLDIPTLPDRLDARGLTWRDYGGIFTDIKSKAGRPEVMDRQDAQFFLDAANGTLPNVSWLNSSFLKGGLEKSGHPPASLCEAETYAAKVLNAVMSSSQWPTTAVFLLWDDWGGFYDHVEPPVVEEWEGGTPFRYGHRVPCLVISPYVRRGYVSHELHSHVSTLHFIETIFDLDPLTERDAAASTMLDCFDFAGPPGPSLTLAPPDCPA